MNRFPVIFPLLITVMIGGCKGKEYTTGEAAYKGECAKCHMLNGKGGKKGPDLTGVFEKHDERYVRDYTIDPRSIKPDSTMPPADLDNKELDMLMEYLKKNAQKRSSANLEAPRNVHR
jgi:mono/diheme cytochrome c family protein